MSERPDYVACIRSPTGDQSKTLCGKNAGNAFSFISIDHAYAAGVAQSRQQSCPACLQNALIGLARSLYVEET